MDAASAVALAVTLGSAASAQAATATQQTIHTETIHTTANHPWLTADRGWVEEGQLTPGEPIITLAGGTSTVAWVQHARFSPVNNLKLRQTGRGAHSYNREPRSGGDEWREQRWTSRKRVAERTCYLLITGADHWKTPLPHL